MFRPSKFIPVSNRDLHSELVPTVQVKSLEQLIASYMASGNINGLEGVNSDSYDFEDAEHIDMDSEIPQNMGKIDAILHYRNIADSRRSPLQAKGVETPENAVKQDVPASAPSAGTNNPQGA